MNTLSDRCCIRCGLKIMDDTVYTPKFDDASAVCDHCRSVYKFRCHHGENSYTCPSCNAMWCLHGSTKLTCKICTPNRFFASRM